MDKWTNTKAINGTRIWINTGTWNVMTMFRPGKLNEIADQMLSTKNTDHCTARNTVEKTWTNKEKYRMQETRTVKAIHSRKPVSKRPTGRPKVH